MSNGQRSIRRVTGPPPIDGTGKTIGALVLFVVGVAISLVIVIAAIKIFV